MKKKVGVELFFTLLPLFQQITSSEGLSNFWNLFIEESECVVVIFRNVFQFKLQNGANFGWYLTFCLVIDTFMNVISFDCKYRSN